MVDGEYPAYFECPDSAPNLPALVYVGIYFTAIANIDSFSNLFQASGYAWYRWQTCQFLDEDGVVYRPDQTLLMENLADQVSDPRPEYLCPDDETAMCPVCDKPRDWTSYLCFQFNGQYFMDFDYVGYPVDSQKLLIGFEDILWDNETVHVLFDTNSSISEDVNIPGFKIKSPLVRENYTNCLASDFGLDSSESFYSHLNIGVKIKRNVTYFILKIIPPTIITVIVSILVVFLDPNELEARLGTAVSGVLSMVFLSTATDSKMPDVGQVTVADWLFNWFFLIILSVVIESVVLHGWLVKFEVIHTEKELSGDDDDKDKGKGPAAGAAAPAASTSAVKPTGFQHEPALNEQFQKKMNLAKLVDKIMAVVVCVAASLGTIIVVLIATYARKPQVHY
eukprot:TRINITY_DN232_c0_g1_i6.p1 TRINITY_DN232_c0_g1~~TRINITY_DN232_c0_g1_i6.p1  ORF type:complete len:451 (+),score=112.98 TRINITY_DN232_c0_g1_i6:172-1353(+)